MTLDMSTQQGAIEIIRGLSLIDDSDANVQRLAGKLDENIRQLKVMRPYKTLYRNFENRDKILSISNAVANLKDKLQQLDPVLKEVLRQEINSNFEINEFNKCGHKMLKYKDEKYSQLIQALLTPIEKSTESIVARYPEKKITKENQKFSVLDIIYDSLGDVFREATGKLTRQVKDGTSYGGLHDFMTSVHKLADIEDSVETAIIGIKKRSK